MARNRGGFGGGGGFASGSNAGPQNRQQTTTAPARGAAARPNRIGRRDTKRSGIQNRRQNSRGRDMGDPSTPFDDEPIGGADTAASELAFENEDYYRQGALGAINDAGFNAAGMGGTQAAWVEGQVGNWIDEFQGQQLTGDPNATFSDFVYGADGSAGSAAGGGAASPFDLPKPNKKKKPNQFKRWQKAKRAHQGAAPPAPVFTPAAAAASPRIQNLAGDWAAASAADRGYESRDWAAPRRVIQFALALFASAGAMISAFASQVLGS